MELLKGIFTRKSIRKYTGKIDDKEIDTLIRAGFAAPTAHNVQPWEFIVIRDENVINDITEIHYHAKFLQNAGTGIIVCGDLKKQEVRDFIIQDCSAAIQNILLTAHGMNLGACWCGIVGNEPDAYEKITKYFNLPENIIPVGLVVVGKKELREIVPRNRYDETKVHYDRW